MVAASNKISKRAERLETGPAETQFRFSGHETFACRFAWLPKAYRFAKELPDHWLDDERAMVELGIGKNMVRSLRFWASAAGLVVNKSGKPEVTEFGELIFGPGGLDPYIEHPTTPWIIHWKFASNPDVPLFFVALHVQQMALSGVCAFRPTRSLTQRDWADGFRSFGYHACATLGRLHALLSTLQDEREP
ncbi:hypothetical protein ACVWZR_002191 [Bradyrhizobium sp. i1.3.1]